MSYLTILLILLLLVGVIGVVANPAPYYGVIGLVLSAGAGCGVLVSFGGSFMGLVLFLIYLGGMLVVFAYSVALAADRQPEHWGDLVVLGYLVGYWLIVLVAGKMIRVEILSVFGKDTCGVLVLQEDTSGVMLLFSVGGGLLLMCGWGLTLTLFVVLELTRGFASGCLRMS
uniref:NADH-ubiquinone oxidoreductase chain 6 n=1 Tax=Uroplatus fimbriatus TaxID=402375 RepID=A0A0A1H9P6_9SAUR|nr:NADH dehydrogenase subunit 6 [Uroplatus fimbriatus]BAP90254.1 NADH dehydrogenase subunit 6 [Uroplatus fimbriatus]